MNRRKLAPDQVREIRRWWSLHQSMPTRRQIARHYQISETTLHRLLAGDRYKEPLQ